MLKTIYMKNQFNLEIKTPCSENFKKFKPTNKGGFCNSCEKDVIDFSKMTSQEIINYFKNNSSKNTCGQFNKQQLKTYTTKPIQRKRYPFFTALGLTVLSFFTFSKIHAQKKTSIKNKNVIDIKSQKENIIINGFVSDESGPLPGTNILLQGTNIGVETDFDGKFKFPKLLKNGDVLVFSFIGFEAKKIVIDNKNSTPKMELKIIMDSDSCMLMGKVAVKTIYKSKK